MLRGNITTKINHLPLKYFDTHETGDIISRITNDVDTIAQNMNQSLASLVTSVTLFIGSVNDVCYKLDYGYYGNTSKYYWFHVYVWNFS
jgi:ABC-type multidrug transport system fused ATPase/permease subunit